MKENSKNRKKEFKVPPGGTLGLLAYGSKGVRAWKAANEEYKIKQQKGE